MTTQAATLVEKQAPGKGLNIALWVVQVLLGAMFIMAGVMKTTKPMADLAKAMPWTAVVGETMVRFIGGSELAGGIGLLLPALTRILPVLTGVAAAGLTLVMVLAAGYHLSHGEAPFIVVNAVLGGLAAFVAWGRLFKAPIAPR